MCLLNLALLTGNLGSAGTGINPLRGQNNVQGAAQMGCDPDNLTGANPLADGRMLFETAWHHSLPATPGLNLMSMVDASLEGRIKALWTIGYDIFLTNPNASVMEQALRSMDCVIVQDMFLNETAHKFGTVFFPARSSFEKDGTFMNAERRIQRIRKAIDPVGESRSDWEIICALASAMGKGEHFAFHSSEEIWNEIRTVWKAAGGITYSRIENQGLQWPCPTEVHPGTRILHTEIPPANKRPVLQTIEYQETEETRRDSGATANAARSASLSHLDDLHILRHIQPEASIRDIPVEPGIRKLHFQKTVGLLHRLDLNGTPVLLIQPHSNRFECRGILRL